MADQTVSDDNTGFAAPEELDTPATTNVYESATYTLEVTPNLPELSIDADTGIASYDGNTGEADYTVTITVTNPDGGTASTTFNLHVNN